MAFVSESLDQFLSERFTRAEDEWADKQINKWERDVPEEVSRVDDILTDPASVSEPRSMVEIQKELFKIPEYLGGRQMTQEEFTNLCDWLGEMKADFNPESLMAALKMFMGQNEYIIDDLMTGGRKYAEGLEHIMRKFGQVK